MLVLIQHFSLAILVITYYQRDATVWLGSKVYPPTRRASVTEIYLLVTLRLKAKAKEYTYAAAVPAVEAFNIRGAWAWAWLILMNEGCGCS